MSYRSKVAIVYLLGFFVDLINMFIANVAYPAIGRDAGVGQPAGVGQQRLYSRPDAGDPAQRPAGAAHRRAAGVSALAGAVHAGHPRRGQRREHRGADRLAHLQGMGGGLLIPIGQTLTYQLYRSHERAGLSAAIMLVGLLAPALSPALGGWLVDRLDWRWVFFANLPLAALAPRWRRCGCARKRRRRRVNRSTPRGC